MTKDEIRHEFLVSVGKVIKRKRNKKNITQEELGKFLGVSKAAVSRYETGNAEIPVSSLPLISGYCNFPLSDYLYEENAKNAVKIFETLIKNCIEDNRKGMSYFYAMRPFDVSAIMKRTSDYHAAIEGIYECLSDEMAREKTKLLNAAGILIQFIEKGQVDDKIVKKLSNITIESICNVKDEHSKKLREYKEAIEKYYKEY